MKRDLQLNTLFNNIETKLNKIEKRSNSCNSQHFSFGTNIYDNYVSPIEQKLTKNNISGYLRTSYQSPIKYSSNVLSSPTQASTVYNYNNNSSSLKNESQDFTLLIHKQIEKELVPIINNMKNDVKILIENSKKEINLNTFGVKDFKKLQEEIVKLKIDLTESQRALESKTNKSLEFIQNETKKKLDKLTLENSTKIDQLNEKIMKIINEKDEQNTKKITDANTKINQANKDIELELQNTKNKMENFEEKHYSALNKINEALKLNHSHKDKELQNLNNIYLDLIKSNSEFQASNVISLNKLKNEIDSISKTNEVILNTKINNLSKEMRQNYLTNQSYEVSKKIFQNNLDDIHQKLSNLSFVSKEDLEDVRNKQVTILDNVQKMGENLTKKILNMSNNLNVSNLNETNKNNFVGLASNHNPNNNEILFKIELFEELLNDHQKILESYNDKFVEKNELKKLTEDFIKKNKICKEFTACSQKVEKIILELHDIRKIIIPKIYEYIEQKNKK